MISEYFSAFTAHFESLVDIDSTGRSDLRSFQNQSGANKIASIGEDDTVFLLNADTSDEKRFQLECGPRYSAIAMHPSGQKCVLGSISKENISSIVQFHFEENTQKTLYTLDKSISNIFQLQYSPNGNYLAIATEEGKVILFNTQTSKIQKCRPGHLLEIVCMSFSWDSKFLLSIGRDKLALINQLDNEPQEVGRIRITAQDAAGMKGSWKFSNNIAYLPGHNQLQTYQLINTKWEHSKKTTFSHPSPIIITQTIKQNMLLTSTKSALLIWCLSSAEQLVVIQNFHLTKCVISGFTFCGMNEDGQIYLYKKQLKDPLIRQLQEQMDVEDNEKSQSRIEFGDSVHEIKDEAEDEQVQQQVKQRQIIQVQPQKKSKADKLITCYPQDAITTFTTLSESSRFLYMSPMALLIQNKESQTENTILLQQPSSTHHKILFRNQQELVSFDINANGVAWCSSTEYGLKKANGESWKKNSKELLGVALGVNWMAVINTAEILIVDLVGHLIRSICFDRQFVAIRAYQNLLVVVYHQSVPIQGSQCLSMALFVVDRMEVLQISCSHLPITPHSILKSVFFSAQGMLFSQDSTGQMRVYSLQTNEWTKIFLRKVSDTRRVWMIGVQNYMLHFWKTTDLQPQPTVSPRMPIKTQQIVLGYCEEEDEAMDMYPSLLWERYCLDHEKARSRLWGNLKFARSQEHPFFNQTFSIKTPQQLTAKHIELDRKFSPLIDHYLNNNQSHKALSLIKSQIRSISIGKDYIEVFDQKKMRGLAIQLEQFYYQQEKESEYVQMQVLGLKTLRQEAERNIKPINDPLMRKNAGRKINESIPSLSQNSSQQMSFDLQSERSYHSQQNIQKEVNKNSMKSSNGVQNPFLKRKSTHQSIEAKKKEIEEQVQAFGVRRKAQKKIGK